MGGQPGTILKATQSLVGLSQQQKVFNKKANLVNQLTPILKAGAIEEAQRLLQQNADDGGMNA